MRRIVPQHDMRGFSMVEVLVALIIIAVGLLGIAKMQALLLANTGLSRVRALIALETSSLAASMHANLDYWANASSWGNAPGGLTVNIDPTNGTSPVTATNSALQSAITAALGSQGGSPSISGSGAPASCETGGGAVPCSPTNMAAYQLTQWEQAMSNVVGNAQTTVQCNTVVTVVTCTITVNWKENTVNANSQEVQAEQSTGNAFLNQTYQLVVNP